VLTKGSIRGVCACLWGHERRCWRRWINRLVQSTWLRTREGGGRASASAPQPAHALSLCACVRTGVRGAGMTLANELFCLVCLRACVPAADASATQERDAVSTETKQNKKTHARRASRRPTSSTGTAIEKKNNILTHPSSLPPSLQTRSRQSTTQVDLPYRDQVPTNTSGIAPSPPPADPRLHLHLSLCVRSALRGAALAALAMADSLQKGTGVVWCT
jgi:hypothetical protein